MVKTLLLIFLIGCSSAPKKETYREWRARMEKQFSGRFYAFGSMMIEDSEIDATSRAKSKAISELVKSISVKVTASSQQKKSYASGTGRADISSTSFESFFKEEVKDFNITSVDTTNSFVHNNEVIVMAVLDKNKFSNVLNKKLNNNLARLSDIHKHSCSDMKSAMNALKNAHLIEKSSYLVETLASVDVASNLKEKDLNEAIQKIDQCRSGISINVVKDPVQLAGAIQSGITSYQIGVIRKVSGKPMNINIHYNCRFKKDGFKWNKHIFSGSCEYRLSNGSKNLTNSKGNTYKVMESDPSYAKIKIETKAKDNLVKDIQNYIKNNL